MYDGTEQPNRLLLALLSERQTTRGMQFWSKMVDLPAVCLFSYRADASALYYGIHCTDVRLGNISHAVRISTEKVRAMKLVHNQCLMTPLDSLRLVVFVVVVLVDYHFALESTKSTPIAMLSKVFVVSTLSP